MLYDKPILVQNMIDIINWQSFILYYIFMNIKIMNIKVLIL